MHSNALASSTLNRRIKTVNPYRPMKIGTWGKGEQAGAGVGAEVMYRVTSHPEGLRDITRTSPRVSAGKIVSSPKGTMQPGVKLVGCARGLRGSCNSAMHCYTICQPEP
jgi:hypothetical protein